MKMKVTVKFYPEGFGIMKPNSYQEKSFKTETDFIIWYDKNYAKIGCVNDYRTLGNKVTHMELLAALNGQCN